jgi:hypothetical protein
VSVALDPALEPRAPEVWLSARCGDDGREVRLVRWDRSPSMVLDGFGPGVYSVFASSFLAAPTTSARVQIDPVSTASLSVTLPSTPPAIATLRAGGSGVAVDAGAPGDARTASVDASARPTWSGRAYLSDGTSAPSVGSVEVDAVSLGAAAEGGEAIEVRVTVRNVCAVSAMNACGRIVLRGVEVRALDGDAPQGVASGSFSVAAIGPGESASLERAAVLRGGLPDAQRALRVAVFGELPRAGQAAMRP